MSDLIYSTKIAQNFQLYHISIYFSFVSLLFRPSVGKKIGSFGFWVWLLGRQKPIVPICGLAFFRMKHNGLAMPSAGFQGIYLSI
jgi:hypothetical protein